MTNSTDILFPILCFFSHTLAHKLTHTLDTHTVVLQKIHIHVEHDPLWMHVQYTAMMTGAFGPTLCTHIHSQSAHARRGHTPKMNAFLTMGQTCIHVDICVYCTHVHTGHVPAVRQHIPRVLNTQAHGESPCSLSTCT